MVRSIAGSLKRIGEGRRSFDEMPIILEFGDHEAVGNSSVEHLWFGQVWYDDENPLVDLVF